MQNHSGLLLIGTGSPIDRATGARHRSTALPAQRRQGALDATPPFQAALEQAARPHLAQSPPDSGATADDGGDDRADAVPGEDTAGPDDYLSAGNEPTAATGELPAVILTIHVAEVTQAASATLTTQFALAALGTAAIPGASAAPETLRTHDLAVRAVGTGRATSGSAAPVALGAEPGYATIPEAGGDFAAEPAPASLAPAPESGFPTASASAGEHSELGSGLKPDPQPTPAALLPVSANPDAAFVASLTATAAAAAMETAEVALQRAERVLIPVAETIYRSVRDGRTEMHLRLDPPDMGEVLVKLVLDAAGVRAHLIVTQPEARAALEGQLDSLRQRLADLGVGVSQCSVELGHGSAGGSGQQSPNQWQRPAPSRRRWLTTAVAAVRPDRQVAATPGFAYARSGFAYSGGQGAWFDCRG